MKYDNLCALGIYLLVLLSMGSCSSRLQTSHQPTKPSEPSEKRYLLYSEEKNELTKNTLELFSIGHPKLICGRNLLEARVKGVDSGTLIFTTSGASTTINPGTAQRYIDIKCPTERCILFISEKQSGSRISRTLTQIDLLPLLEQTH